MSKGRETKRKERREKAQRITIENNKQKRETLNDLLRIKDVRYTAINLRRVMWRPATRGAERKNALEARKPARRSARPETGIGLRADRLIGFKRLG